MARLSDLPDSVREDLVAAECPRFDSVPWVAGPALAERRVAIISTAGLHRRGANGRVNRGGVVPLTASTEGGYTSFGELYARPKRTARATAGGGVPASSSLCPASAWARYFSMSQISTTAVTIEPSAIITAPAIC